MGNREFFKIEYLSEVSSTNTLLKEEASFSAEGRVLVADRQSAGRGRKDRRFLSSGNGLYASVLLRPKCVPAALCGRFTVMAAVAVRRAIACLGFMPEIKWVNDIYLENKKVSGILAESAIDGKGNLSYVVIGIGVNIAPPSGGFPEEIENIAAALYSEYTAGRRDLLLDRILNELYSLYKKDQWEKILEEYRVHSLLIGKKVTVIEGRYQGIATVLGIDDECRLVVEAPCGRLVLDGGEVRIKV